MPNHVNFFSRPLLLVLYIIYSFYLLFKNKKSLAKTLGYNTLHPNFRWLLLLLTFALLLSVSQSAIIFWCIQNKSLDFYYSTNIFHILSGIGLIGIITITFFYPSVLYGLTRVDAPANLSEKIREAANEEKKEHPFAEKQMEKENHDFDAHYIVYIEHTIKNCMETDKPYLQKDCNLNYFAKIVNLPAHHLYYYFREIKKQAFTDFRNEWRIKHAKDLIRKNKNKVYTIEAIGMLSGFTSKNAFFASFKKYEKTTPGNYAQHNQD
jgi:AraC-like DNA-binding protein